MSAMDLGRLDISHAGGSVLGEKSPGSVGVGSPCPVSSPTAASSTRSASKIGKSKMMREAGQSTNCLSKVTSQIKKPPRRKTSPVNWFPRKKGDSYLERKIKMLQELDGNGLNLTLDETLGDANPHYCRVLREKMAAREAADKAMEARKSALIEASWCRILRAARIQTKEAQQLLEKAERAATEAFEAAADVGVIMYDKPNGPQKHSTVEMPPLKGAGFTTHAVTASFETAFEVDREVAAAVKTAMVKLVSCPLFSTKVEFNDLLHKIRQNPEEDNSHKDLLEVSSECESESGSDFERASQTGGLPVDINLNCAKRVEGRRQRKAKRRHSLEKLNKEKIVDMMFERLKCLQENELSSLATIVATCGLNAALAEVGNSKSHEPAASSISTYNARRMSSYGVGSGRNSYFDRFIKKSHVESELPSLDKFLVKHETKLEREVREAKDHNRAEASNRAVVARKKGDKTANSELPTLDKFLVKHLSKLERDVLEAKACKNSTDISEVAKQEVREFSDSATNLPETTRSLQVEDADIGDGVGNELRNSGKCFSQVPSLDKVLVKHVSRLEQEVLEARNRRKNELSMKENMNSNVDEKEVKGDSLDKILVKPVDRLDREKQHALSSRRNYEYKKQQRKHEGDETRITDCESLDKVLVKHVSRLEREKMMLKEEEFLPKAKRDDSSMQSQDDKRDGLDRILMRHKSRLEMEKATSSSNPKEETSFLVSRKAAREKELQEAWGGVSLGNAIKPRLSKLEQEKAAWIKAEEEERGKAVKGM